SAGSLGGVARKTRESIILCEAAGYGTIFIETVGVGQSETVVHSMIDFFLLLMLAGAGDELQGIKRGIMEMADAIAINKADGNNVQKANLAKAQYQNALHLFPPTESAWIPKVITCSALENTGISDIWDTVLNYLDLTENNGFYKHNRNRQAKFWMHQTIQEAIRDRFYQDEEMKNNIGEFERKVVENEISSFVAANKLLDLYFTK
ncbi:MAG: methylmalonyl Co-A mutase-associated GTPase MeaB, partial [Bacteroidales bacterium]|nr:methylmalonyl Co-A mutase-associated GTPase MeaB [Bacteroidales bacterium]